MKSDVDVAVAAVEVEVAVVEDDELVVAEGDQSVVKVLVIVTVVVAGMDVVPLCTVRVVVADGPAMMVTVAASSCSTTSRT